MCRFAILPLLKTLKNTLHNTFFENIFVTLADCMAATGEGLKTS